MRLLEYYDKVLLPANAAVSAMRRAGLPVDLERLGVAVAGWEERLKVLEAEVEAEAARCGTPLRYSAAHGVSPQKLASFIYQGLGLVPSRKGKTGPSTDADALAEFASIKVPRPDDHPFVTKVLQIRSFAGAIAKANAYRETRRSDGCCHPKFNWALRTSRLSAEDPPVHQIPEKSDPAVANAIKSCMVPRVAPAPCPEDWDPRKHGSVLRWDIDGAEAAIRAAMLTARFCTKPDPAWEYIRSGKDIHAHTASLIYGRPEGEFKKGHWERDVVAKATFFARQFGGEYGTIQETIWSQARMRIDDAEARRICEAFDTGHPRLVELLEQDKERVGTVGFCEDGYGRRRWVGPPPGVRYLGRGPEGVTRWRIPHGQRALLARAWHVAANTPTQSMNATDCLWMIALAVHGEYVPLAVPPMWEAKGLDFPEAAGWRLHGGPGPGGKPFLGWYSNTVHDSAWGDCAPGYLEPMAKLVWRRCRGLPFDWRLEADVPYRVSISVGPDFGHLRSYAKAAKEFSLEPLE